MRVAFGTTVLERGLARESVDGIGNYSRELLYKLSGMNGVQTIPFTYSQTKFSEIRSDGLGFGPFAAQALYSLATGLSFPVAKGRISGRFDLVHATDHLIPSIRNLPVIATLMDAIPLSHPEWVAYSFRNVKNMFWRRTSHWATHVVTISSHAKEELIEWFRLPEQRISVTPLGVDQRWFATPSRAEVNRINVAYALPEQFFLFVGTLQPRKNVARLITAHRMLPTSVRNEYPLVVVGRAGWECEGEVNALKGGDEGALRWLRYVPEADLVTLVGRATCLVFPSLHEGFGLPVLEAFAAGVPVITSNSTSLPEVAGDAALLVNPERTDELSDAMRALVGNVAMADRLRIAGRERAARFTWDRTAALTVKVYQQALASF